MGEWGTGRRVGLKSLRIQHKTYSKVLSESIAQTKIIVDQQFLIFTLIYSMKLS